MTWFISTILSSFDLYCFKAPRHNLKVWPCLQCIILKHKNYFVQNFRYIYILWPHQNWGSHLIINTKLKSKQISHKRHVGLHTKKLRLEQKLKTLWRSVATQNFTAQLQTIFVLFLFINSYGSMLELLCEGIRTVNGEYKTGMKPRANPWISWQFITAQQAYGR